MSEYLWQNTVAYVCVIYVYETGPLENIQLLTRKNDKLRKLLLNEDKTGACLAG